MTCGQTARTSALEYGSDGGTGIVFCDSAWAVGPDKELPQFSAVGFFFESAKFGVQPLLDLLLNGLRLHSALQAPGLVLIYDFRDDGKVFIGEQPLELLRRCSASGIVVHAHQVTESAAGDRAGFSRSSGRGSSLATQRPGKLAESAGHQ